MSISYGWEKLFTAVYNAITSDEPPQKRLANVYAYHLIHLQEDDVPEDVWNELKALGAAVTSTAGEQGAIAASTSKMSDEEARKWLQKVAEMFSEVAQAYGVEMQPTTKVKFEESETPYKTAADLNAALEQRRRSLPRKTAPKKKR